MGRYVLYRAVQAVILMVGVSIIGFSLMHLAPGGPLAVYTLNPTVTSQDISRITHIYGLDQPVHIQYLKWASGMLTGNWGFSFFGGRPVLDVVLERIPATLELMGTGIALAIVVGVFIGVLGAVKRYSIFDYLATTGAMVALSLPTFWFGLIAIFVFSQQLRWLPAGGMMTIGSSSGVVDNLRHLILPALVLALVLVAQWSRYTRSAMLEVLEQDYMRTARAKGLTRRAVLLHHAFGNALVPLVTLAGLQIPALFGGALVTETVFSWPGMGLLFVNSLSTRDYPVLMAILMMTAVLVIAGNFLADIAVAVVDPRIKLRGA